MDNKIKMRVGKKMVERFGVTKVDFVEIGFCAGDLLDFV